MTDHTFTLYLGTAKLGLTVEELRNLLAREQIKCLLCGTLVDITEALRHDVEAFVQAHEGDEAKIVLELKHHPPDITRQILPGAEQVTDETRLQEHRELYALIIKQRKERVHKTLT